MKVLLINGSPRINGNTKKSLEVIEKTLKENGIESKHIQLGGINIKGCSSCYACAKTLNKKCAIVDDLTPIMEQCYSDDTVGIVIGSPVYFSNVTSEVKAFIDRVGLVAKFNTNLLKNKVGAAVVVNRRAGATFTYSAINFFFGITEMPIATSSYWNLAVASKSDDLQRDVEGVKTFVELANNMANLIKSLNKK